MMTQLVKFIFYERNTNEKRMEAICLKNFSPLKKFVAFPIYRRIHAIKLMYFLVAYDTQSHNMEDFFFSLSYIVSRSRKIPSNKLENEEKRAEETENRLHLRLPP